jgi:ribulose-5-phosphate 4-epimerase/fuculose-1-phosphate aldolase
VGAGDLATFREAGRALLSLGMIRGSEGNLSTWDGERLVITRTGSELAHLEEADVLEGSLDAAPDGASSDLAIHVRTYREAGPGAIAHAHPPGSVPAGWVEGREHGRYAHAATLEAAVERIVREARAEA